MRFSRALKKAATSSSRPLKQPKREFASTSNERASSGPDQQIPPLAETEVIEFVKRVSKDEKLFRTAVGRAMSPKMRKRWIQSLVTQQLESDLHPLEGSGVAGPTDSQLTKERQEKADQIFNTLDVNNDGFVAAREFRIWFSTYYFNRFKNAKQVDAKDLPAIQKLNTELLEDTRHSTSQLNGTAIVDAPSEVAEQTVPKSGVKEDADEEDEEVDWKTLCHVMLRSSIPYLAFGIIDNGLMLSCGEWIDSTVAMKFGLSTMASAGLGNTLSCATGVVTGGFIERMCLRSRVIGQHSPVLSPSQAVSLGVRNAHIAGSVLGILVGCLIGMFPLLFVKKHSRSSDSPPPQEEVQF